MRKRFSVIHTWELKYCLNRSWLNAALTCSAGHNKCTPDSWQDSANKGSNVRTRKFKLFQNVNYLNLLLIKF